MVRASSGALPSVMRVITRLNIGGPARHALILHDRLPELGFDSTLVFGTQDSSEGTLLPEDAERTIHLSGLGRDLNPVSDFGVGRCLSELVGKARPAIVHTHMAKAGALGRSVAFRHGVPVTVHTFHGHVLSGYFSSPVTRAFLEIERRLARRTTRLVAVSARIRDDLLEMGVGRPDQWVVIPVGLELDPLLESAPDRERCRRLLNLPLEGPLVGIVGRLAPIKDVPTFIGACELVAAKHPDASFVVVGDGPIRGALHREAYSRLGGRVRFTGWITNLTALYGALDVVVLTSRNEGTPVALIEASAAGKPVVGTDVGGVADVIRHGGTGFLCAAGSREEIAERVGYLLDHKEAAASMGLQGKEYVRSQFAASRLVEDVASLYRALVASECSVN